jgi:hypothetical protein
MKPLHAREKRSAASEARKRVQACRLLMQHVVKRTLPDSRARLRSARAGLADSAGRLALIGHSHLSGWQVSDRLRPGTGVLPAASEL